MCCHLCGAVTNLIEVNTCCNAQHQTKALRLDSQGLPSLVLGHLLSPLFEGGEGLGMRLTHICSDRMGAQSTYSELATGNLLGRLQFL